MLTGSNGISYDVEFTRNRVEIQPEGLTPRMVVQTICTITNSDNEEIISGAVRLNSLEPDSRPAAKHFAFGAAIKNSTLSKEERAELWTEFRLKMESKSSYTKEELLRGINNNWFSEHQQLLVTQMLFEENERLITNMADDSANLEVA